MDSSLEGLVVVDASEGIAGSYCTKLLAGLGAEVIKVERPGTGDPVRAMPPFKDDAPHIETSGVHLHLSMAKKSVTLDVTSASGRDLLRRLISSCDVFVESFTPGTLSALGLGYEDLSKAQPSLVMTSITPFGQTGPYSQYKGGELVEYSAGGYTYLTGLPDREPIKAGGSQAEYQGGLHGAVATMAAISLRSLTGEGDHLDVSITEAVNFTTRAMPAYLNGGQVYERVGARLLEDQPTALYPSTILPCKGDFIHAHWCPADPSFLGVLTENPRLSDPELWATPRAHAEEIDELLTAWLSQYDKFEAVKRAQELRHPFAEVLNPADVLEDPQFLARNYFWESSHPAAGTLKHLGGPFVMSETPWRQGLAPLLGEHNWEIYGGRLGLSREQLAILREGGIV